MTTGDYFIENRDTGLRIKFLAISMAVSLGVTIILSFQYGLGKPLVPIVKALWSYSYIALANFFTSTLMLLLFVLHDQRLFMGWPYRPVGLNGLLIYLLSKLLANRFPFGFMNDGNHLSMTISNLMGLIIFIWAGTILHKYRFYVKF